MKIIQLTNIDGDHVGLYLCDENLDDLQLQNIFEECERKAEMAEEQWADEDEEDDAFSIFENYLSEKNIKRIFATEIYTNLI